MRAFFSPARYVSRQPRRPPGAHSLAIHSSIASLVIGYLFGVPLSNATAPWFGEPPLNHVGLWIDDLPRAVEWLSAQGVRFAPGGIRRGAAGFDITFIHPKGNDASPIGGEGVLIELVQAPPEVIAAFT